MKNAIYGLLIVLINFSVNGQTITNYTTSDGLLSNNVNCVDVDATNTVWFGTQNGVSEFNGVSWVDHTTVIDAGLIDNNIQAIYAASSGDVWVGTDFGVSVYDGSWTSYTTADGLGNNQIKCIGEDLNGDIWFGTSSGASQFDGLSWNNFGTAEGLPFGGVNSITTHTNGDLWMGTGLSGVMVYDWSNFTAITTTDGLIDDRIRAIAIDVNDNKWVGTSEGISVFNSSDLFQEHHTTIFTLPAPDTLNPIEDVEIDSQGNIWAGVYVDYLVTEGGVCAFNGNQWVEYKVADGLVGPVVRALAIDGNDNVWVATSTGVSKISDPTLGAENIENLNSFELFPNPSRDVVFVRHAQDIETTIDIFNASMQKVNSVSMIGNNLQSIDVSNYAQGLYYVRLNGEVKKLLIH